MVRQTNHFLYSISIYTVLRKVRVIFHIYLTIRGKVTWWWQFFHPSPVLSYVLYKLNLVNHGGMG